MPIWCGSEKCFAAGIWNFEQSLCAERSENWKQFVDHKHGNSFPVRLRWPVACAAQPHWPVFIDKCGRYTCLSKAVGKWFLKLLFIHMNSIAEALKCFVMRYLGHQIDLQSEIQQWYGRRSFFKFFFGFSILFQRALDNILELCRGNRLLRSCHFYKIGGKRDFDLHLWTEANR